jgi:hypothetical protein
VVSLELEEGRITTTGGLTSVFVVTVLLLTLGAAGTVVVTVLLDSVEVWHHALPARPTVIPIAATEIHKLKALISSILLFVKCSSRAPGHSFHLAALKPRPVFSVGVTAYLR